MSVPDATAAYMHYCLVNKIHNIYVRMEEAIDRGDNEVVYQGVLPPAVIDDLESRGYLVQAADVSKFDKINRQYTVRWG